MSAKNGRSCWSKSAQSQETIERSRELIARLDKLLAGLEGA